MIGILILNASSIACVSVKGSVAISTSGS